ncbi:MAG: DUF4384 domain-containing protein [Candidatus Eremiobacterota bacterium]
MKFKFLLVLLIILIPCMALSEEASYTVVPFKGSDQKLSFELAEMLMADLAKSGQIKLVDRLHFDNILDELAKKEMALVDPNEAVDFGAAEGADEIISGSYTIDGNKISLRAWVSNVKTSQVRFSDNVEGSRGDIFYFAHQLANRLHYKITGGKWIPEETAFATPVPEATPQSKSTPGPLMPTPVSTPTPEYVNVRPDETDPSSRLFSGDMTAKTTGWNNILDLSVDRGEFSTYHQKDKMFISFRSSENCYITIYCIQADGSVLLVYPNRMQKDNYLTASRLYKIPPEQAVQPWEYEMSGTPGLESLVAIASVKPLSFDVNKEDLDGMDFIPQVNSIPKDFIVKTIIPKLNIDPDNKYVVKVLKYYLAE